MRVPSLLIAFAFVLSACSAQIQHGLAENDANEILSVLSARGYEARKVLEKGKKPTWAIEVDDAVAMDAMRVLTELKLPRPERTTTRQLASQTSLIETPAAERLRQLEAQEGDIEQALESMDGVASAAVELVVPPPPRPGIAAAPSKAAVLLRVEASSVERVEMQRAELRALVAGAVDGLDVDSVTLVVDPVVSQVPPPKLVAVRETGRWLVYGLLALVAVLFSLLAVVALRLRVAKAAPVEPAASPASRPAPSRPVINPAVQRKVA